MFQTGRLTAQRFSGSAAPLRDLRRVMKIVRSAAGHWHTAWLALLLVQGVLPVASVYLTRSVVNSFLATVRAGAEWESARSTLGLVLLMLAILIIGEALAA